MYVVGECAPELTNGPRSYVRIVALPVGVPKVVVFFCTGVLVV